MLTLSFPKPSNTVYPRLRFGDLGNLQRQTAFNRKAFFHYVRAQPFHTENEHVLVGLLQQLSINKDWDLSYVVSYTRFRAYSLCTLFNITSLGHVGKAITNGFYRNSVREHWCLIENTKQYSAPIDFVSMCPVVPLCSTVTERSYSHPLNRDKTVNGQINDLAIIGVDLVELAVAWWAYQQMDYERDTGIRAFVAQIPLANAQLIHNQLTVINTLYDHFVHQQPLKSVMNSDKVVFNTVSEQRLMDLYLTFLGEALTGRRLFNLEHLLVTLESIYKQPYFNYVPAGKNALFTQTSWVWEPALMKLYSIYLSICNHGNYPAADINSVVERSHLKRVNNYQRIPESYFKGWFLELADELNTLNRNNLKK